MPGTTRRSISVKGLTHQLLTNHAEARGTSVSGVLEELIDEKLTALGVPHETSLRPRPSAPPRVTENGGFTF